MFSRLIRRRALPSFRTCNTRIPSTIQRRTLVRAPKSGDGPLMERRPDRELPNVESDAFRWRRHFPIFLIIITLSSAAIFNYQKLSSPIVASVLYSLRTSQKARELLGDEVYFYHQIPWISGTMNQLRGKIDISFRVKGTKREGVVRFRSYRPTARGVFETEEWSLELEDEDGKQKQVVDLMDGEDPFRVLEGFGMDEEEREEAMASRGFRTQLK